MKILKSNILLLLLAVFIGTLCSCGRASSSAETSADKGNDLHHARMLRLWDEEGYTVAEVLTPGDTSKVLTRYVMVPKDSVLPEDLPEGVLLRTPLERMIVFSSVYTDALDELGASGSVAGIMDSQYMTTPSILEGLKSGKVVDCGSSMAPTLEKMIAAKSDAVVYCQYEGMEINGLERPGIPLVTMVDNYETDPLGRAEWLLFLGQLTGQREQAEKIFGEVSARYKKVADEAMQNGKRPKVMTDNLYQGVWYVPGGKSYQAKLIGDAGGDYILKDDSSTGSLSLSLEEMMVKGKDADIWIFRSFSPVGSLEGLRRVDSRYSSFPPFKSGEVYEADSSETDIFSLSAFHPDEILAEYSKIFKGGEGKYYKKLK